MAGPLMIIAKASPWVLKQVPKLCPLLLDARNRERIDQAVTAALFSQQCGDGLVEARCADGLRLSDGRVVETSGPET